MHKPLILASLLLAAPSLAAAQAKPAAPPARRPSIELSIEMAQAALAACTAAGHHSVAVVLDSARAPVVAIRSEGAIATVDATAGKAYTALKYGVDSGVAADRADTDAAFAKEIADDPLNGVRARRGALLLKVGNDIIGAFAVGGSGPGINDEACAKAGLAKVASRLR